MREIVISIDTDTLELKIEAEGYKGDGCTKDLEEITRLLDAKTLTRRSKPERTIRVQRGQSQTG